MAYAEFGAEEALKIVTGELTPTETRRPTYLALSFEVYTYDDPVLTPPSGEVNVAGYSRAAIHMDGVWADPVKDTVNSLITRDNAEDISFGPFGQEAPEICSWFITTAAPGQIASEDNILAWDVLDEPRPVLEFLQLVFRPGQLKIVSPYS